MGTNPGKWLVVILLICTMVLSGCASAPDGQETAPPPETTKATQPTTPTEPSAASQPTEPLQTEPTAGDPEDPSLVSLRQAMIETPQVFAVAYFGWMEEDTDVFSAMEAAAPQLCEDLPFLLQISEGNIIGTYGHLFCIVPRDEDASVAVNRRSWNTETGAYGDSRVLYRSESGTPILLLCPNENDMPDTDVMITAADGTLAFWSAHMDGNLRIAPLCNDREESLLFDFTAYDQLPAPEEEGDEILSVLAGSWDRIWTEVEGDRTDSLPGACTVLITADETGALRMSYTDRDFPDDNFADRELVVTPGELYPGCGNDQWIATVTPAEGDMLGFTLTVLEDGTLLLQLSFDFDGMPMVSYSCYRRTA